jgi:hypothetical protein
MKSRKRKPMLASKKTKRGVIGAIVLAGVLAVGGYAYTNALVVEDLSNAGTGEEFVSDLVVDDDSISFEPNAVDPQIAEEVSFTATAAAPVGQVNAGAPTIEVTDDAFIRLIDGTGAWYECDVTSAGGTATETFTCDLTGTAIDFEDIDRVRVVLFSNTVA